MEDVEHSAFQVVLGGEAVVGVVPRWVHGEFNALGETMKTPGDARETIVTPGAAKELLQQLGGAT